MEPNNWPERANNLVKQLDENYNPGTAVELLSLCRKHKLRCCPEAIAKYGLQLLQEDARRLGKKVWDAHEQVCAAALEVGDLPAAMFSFEKLKSQNPESPVVKQFASLFLQEDGRKGSDKKLFDGKFSFGGFFRLPVRFRHRPKGPMMRYFDKIGFSAGVLAMVVSEFVLLKAPSLFWLWYLIVVPALITIKYFNYKQSKWQYFLLDFCYVVNLNCILEVLFLPPHTALSVINFCCATGPLGFAIPLWRNSLVFHNLDMISSVYIHLFPCIVTFCGRWYPHLTPALLSGFYSEPPENPHQMTITHFLLSFVVYVVWQVLYLIKTDLIDARNFQDDPKLVNSLIWMAKDTKNPTSQAVLKFCRRVGLFAPDEPFNPNHMKTKLVFVATQFAFTLGSIAVTPIVYHFYWLNVALIAYFFVMSVHNGAGYYIEVFSRRYAKQFVEEGW